MFGFVSNPTLPAVPPQPDSQLVSRKSIRTFCSWLSGNNKRIKFMSPPKTFQEAESIYDRATKLEFAAEFSSAFHFYLEATDAFLHLSRSSVATPAFQAQCKARAAKAIQRAEKIKKASKTPGSQLGVVLAPVNCFGADHQAYVLRKSSTVNNIRYPLWNEPVPLPSTPGTHYSDPNGQPAIPQSKTIKWKRPPRDVLAPQELFSTSSLTPADIYQNIIDDCSLCASVAVCIQHNRRFNSRLLSSSLLPGNQPSRYDLRAYLNGDCRRVSIDDLLPFNDSEQPVGISSGRMEVAWPALIEKAYMKLMGGYDFPGSVLTGWIPEQLELQSPSFEREKTWERIVNGFRKGYCVVTVGTDAKTTLEMEGVKLLPSHAYAVVGIQETKNERWLTLIDSRVPTANSPTNRLDGSNSSDTRTLDMRWDDICAAFEGIYASWDPALLPYGATLHEVWKLANANDKVQASVRHLRLLYECQNPPYGSGDPLDTSKYIWVLLTRHLFHTRREAEYISLSVHHEDEDDRRDMWLKPRDTEVKGTFTTSPHVLVKTRAGRGVPPPSHTPSSASPTSTKISGALLIHASYDGPFDDVCFTVNVFCGADVKVQWDEDVGTGDAISPGGGGFSVKVDGTLTSKNAGGNHTHPTYMLNPQWHLLIYDESTSSSGGGALASRERASPLRGFGGSSKLGGVSGKSKTGQKSAVVLSAQGPREVPLNVTAVWSSGERIVGLAEKEVVTSSGHIHMVEQEQRQTWHYRKAGSYTVILSAFEPQVHLGQFTLSIESSRQFDLTPIPQEGAGMYARVSKGEWDEHTAAGRPSHGRYHLNPIYEIQLPSNAQLCARLHLTSAAPTAALNLSLFPAPSSASKIPRLDRALASSGPYSDTLSGVSIPTRMLSPGKYWLILSTFTAGVRASFQLAVYCSDAGCVVSRQDRSPAKS
ncbi:hypothetical protein JVT61DRAFT_605 [Boletus reticuloceps]|uniref:Calpain catalytic domain-containing protein n=1 Tax=Boletus reticuloceps TaxID=495285 RepID=A0A8I2Z3D2_9AGAM|nr:hypothetical protein JVT61DRAFT_605 [Boletus reticuloceps]